MTARPDSDVAVRCVDLSIARTPRSGPDIRVIDGVSFVLPHAGALALMGATGSGKSSLAAIIAGIETTGLAVVGGSGEVEGVSLRRRGRSHRVRTYLTGYLAQSAGASLPARQTVSEVIGEPISSRDKHVNRRALAVRVASLLDELMLPLGCAPKYPYELSAGMRQRVAFARALVLEPRVLVADEPVANMDVEVRRAALEAIRRRQHDRGMSALIVTNDIDVVHTLDADVLVLRAGHTIGYGHGPKDVLWTPGGESLETLALS